MKRLFFMALFCAAMIHPASAQWSPGYFTATKPQSVESIQNSYPDGTIISDVRVQKVLRDGMLFIERDGKTYNAQGAEVR